MPDNSLKQPGASALWQVIVTKSYIRDNMKSIGLVTNNGKNYKLHTIEPIQPI